jgi:hypothetical protein
MRGQRQTVSLRTGDSSSPSHVCAGFSAQEHSFKPQFPLHFSQGARTIGFRTEENKIRIEIISEVAEKVQLKIGSKLQAHAKREIGWQRSSWNVVL